MTTDIAAILGDVLTTVRGVSIRRLEVTHPGDDDNLWFVQQGAGRPEVQVEAGPDGALPVLVEGERIGQRASPTTREGAVNLIVEWLVDPT